MLFHIQFASSCFRMMPLCCLTCFVTLFSFQGAGLQPLLQSDLKIRPFTVRSSNPKANRLVGPSGLEPPTLRLSVVRSSQLSYGPSSSQSPLSSVSGFAENFSRSLAPPLQITNASLVCDLSLDGGTLYSLGGDSRVRTGDLLLARQALSQLSYTPIPQSFLVVGPSGLEPPTSRLSVVRSSQLSYGPVQSLTQRAPSKLNNVTHLYTILT